jgi:hypothetical protein
MWDARLGTQKTRHWCGSSVVGRGPPQSARVVHSQRKHVHFWRPLCLWKRKSCASGTSTRDTLLTSLCFFRTLRCPQRGIGRLLHKSCRWRRARSCLKVLAVNLQECMVRLFGAPLFRREMGYDRLQVERESQRGIASLPVTVARGSVRHDGTTRPGT